MKDLFKNYHKHKVLSNAWILSIAALLAVSVNMFILSGNTGQTLKANVLEATSTQVSSVDVLAAANESTISLSNTQEMQNVMQLSFSLAYNPEILSLWASQTLLWDSEISVIENNDGFSNYILTSWSPLNITAGSELVNISYAKPQDETVHLNIINVNFTDNQDESYLLSSKWIIF